MNHSSQGFAERLKASLSKESFRDLKMIPHYVPRTTSTQDYLMRVLKSKIEGEFVVSGTQSKGRGREGRSWYSDRGGLYLSITLTPKPHNVSKLALLCASCVKDTLSRDFSLPGCAIKEPNDVICNEKKISGILVDAEIEGDAARAYVGIGVNMNNGSKWKSEMRKIATSYALETGRTVALEKFTVSLLSNLDREYHRVRSR